MAETKITNGDVFNKLGSIDTSKNVEVKKTGNTELKYLSWTFAVEEVKKNFPDMTYTVKKFKQIERIGDVIRETELPYMFDSNTGYMVATEVTINGLTHEMWLPVMDSHNAAMKNVGYTVKTKYSEYAVPAASMFDVNKTIMRCLVKNLAMFGLGLNIYAGEDLPVVESEEVKSLKSKVENMIKDKTITDPGYVAKAQSYINTNDVDGLQKIISYYESQKKTA